jgi:AraC-like DNA-binding protein
VSGLLHEGILRVCKRGSLDQRNTADKGLAAIILDEMERQDRSSIALIMPVDPRARRLADQFLTNVQRDASMDELCARVGLSRRTAERLYLDQTGLPPAQWRRLAGLTESLVRIAGGERIEDAAFAVGYQSRSAFSEAFTRVFGFPPSKAR